MLAESMGKFNGVQRVMGCTAWEVVVSESSKGPIPFTNMD